MRRRLMSRLRSSVFQEAGRDTYLMYFGILSCYDIPMPKFFYFYFVMFLNPVTRQRLL